VGDVKINLCFVAIVNKEKKIPGEIQGFGYANHIGLYS
jgi:hypothetical protein